MGNMAKAAVVDVAVVDADPDSRLTLWQLLRKWRRVVGYSLGLSAGVLMYGFDYAIIGATSAMPSFQQDYGQRLGAHWILPSLWFGLWTLSSPLGSMLGAVAAGWFQDWHGRRAALALGALVSAAGVAVSYASGLAPDLATRRAVFLAGKMVQGFSLGLVMTTTQTFMSEMLPPGLRGPLLALFPIFVLLGQLIGAVVIYTRLAVDRGYLACFASQWPFAVAPLLVALVVPESPTYLVRKGRLDRARKAQRRLLSDDADTHAIIDAIQRNIEHERKSAKATYLDCFRRANLRRTLIVVFAAMLPHLFGIMLLANASYFGQVVGMDAQLSLVVLILGIVLGLLANTASIWLLSCVGRRRLILVGLAALTLLWGSLGVSGFWTGPGPVWYTAVVINLITVASGLCVWPTSYGIGAEASALHLRAKAQGICWLTAGLGAALFGFVLPYVYNPDQGNLKGKTGFIFAVLCAAGFVLAFFCLPEMKGRTASEIDCMFELGLPARQFSKWSNPKAAASTATSGDAGGCA